MKFTYGWKYPDGTRVKVGDTVLVSQKAADRYGHGDRLGTICRMVGFVTVRLKTGAEVDLDMRSIRKAPATVE